MNRIIVSTAIGAGVLLADHYVFYGSLELAAISLLAFISLKK